MSDLTNREAASSLAELFLQSQTQDKNGFQEFLHETGITSYLCRDSSDVIDALVVEFAELTAKFGLDTTTYPDAAERIEQINRSLYAASAILAEIADYAESSAGASDDNDSDDSDDSETYNAVLWSPAWQ